MHKKTGFIHKLLPVAGILTAGLALFAYLAIAPVEAPVSPGHAVPVSYVTHGALQSPGDVHGYQDERLSAGKILVATEKLKDPHFARTIVLLLNYSSRGAAGLVINRPTDTKPFHILPDVKGIRQVTDNLYFGGPVARNLITMIIQSPARPEASLKVFGDIYISNSPGVLEQMIAHRKPDQRFRLYSGYAGWRAGQLESELARHDWRVLNGTPDILFNKAPDKIWQKLVPQGITI
jgi:putative transcriptional regulator